MAHKYNSVETYQCPAQLDNAYWQKMGNLSDNVRKFSPEYACSLEATEEAKKRGGDFLKKQQNTCTMYKKQKARQDYFIRIGALTALFVYFDKLQKSIDGNSNFTAEQKKSINTALISVINNINKIKQDYMNSNPSAKSTAAEEKSLSDTSNIYNKLRDQVNENEAAAAAAQKNLAAKEVEAAAAMAAAARLSYAAKQAAARLVAAKSRAAANPGDKAAAQEVAEAQEIEMQSLEAANAAEEAAATAEAAVSSAAEAAGTAEAAADAASAGLSDAMIDIAGTLAEGMTDIGTVLLAGLDALTTSAASFAALLIVALVEYLQAENAEYDKEKTRNTYAGMNALKTAAEMNQMCAADKLVNAGTQIGLKSSDAYKFLKNGYPWAYVGYADGSGPQSIQDTGDANTKLQLERVANKNLGNTYKDAVKRIRSAKARWNSLANQWPDQYSKFWPSSGYIGEDVRDEAIAAGIHGIMCGILPGVVGLVKAIESILPNVALDDDKGGVWSKFCKQNAAGPEILKNNGCAVGFSRFHYLGDDLKTPTSPENLSYLDTGAYWALGNAGSGLTGTNPSDTKIGNDPTIFTTNDTPALISDSDALTNPDADSGMICVKNRMDAYSTSTPAYGNANINNIPDQEDKYGLVSGAGGNLPPFNSKLHSIGQKLGNLADDALWVLPHKAPGKCIPSSYGMTKDPRYYLGCNNLFNSTSCKLGSNKWDLLQGEPGRTMPPVAPSKAIDEHQYCGTDPCYANGKESVFCPAYGEIVDGTPVLYDKNNTTTESNMCTWVPSDDIYYTQNLQLCSLTNKCSYPSGDPATNISSDCAGDQKGMPWELHGCNTSGTSKTFGVPADANQNIGGSFYYDKTKYIEPNFWESNLGVTAAQNIHTVDNSKLSDAGATGSRDPGSCPFYRGEMAAFNYLQNYCQNHPEKWTDICLQPDAWAGSNIATASAATISTWESGTDTETGENSASKTGFGQYNKLLDTLTTPWSPGNKNTGWGKLGSDPGPQTNLKGFWKYKCSREPYLKMCHYDPEQVKLNGDGWIMPKYVLPGGLPPGAVVPENFAAGNSILIKIASIDPPALYIGNDNKKYNISFVPGYDTSLFTDGNIGKQLYLIDAIKTTGSDQTQVSGDQSGMAEFAPNNCDMGCFLAQNPSIFDKVKKDNPSVVPATPANPEFQNDAYNYLASLKSEDRLSYSCDSCQTNQGAPCSGQYELCPTMGGEYGTFYDNDSGSKNTCPSATKCGLITESGPIVVLWEHSDVKSQKNRFIVIRNIPTMVGWNYRTFLNAAIRVSSPDTVPNLQDSNSVGWDEGVSLGLDTLSEFVNNKEGTINNFNIGFDITNSDNITPAMRICNEISNIEGDIGIAIRSNTSKSSLTSGSNGNAYSAGDCALGHCTDPLPSGFKAVCQQKITKACSAASPDNIANTTTSKTLQQDADAMAKASNALANCIAAIQPKPQNPDDPAICSIEREALKNARDKFDQDIDKNNPLNNVNLLGTCGCYMDNSIYEADIANQRSLGLQVDNESINQRACWNEQCIAATTLATQGSGTGGSQQNPMGMAQMTPIGEKPSTESRVCNAASCIQIESIAVDGSITNSNITFNQLCSLNNGNMAATGSIPCVFDEDCEIIKTIDSVKNPSGPTFDYICGSSNGQPNEPGNQRYCFRKVLAKDSSCPLTQESIKSKENYDPNPTDPNPTDPNPTDPDQTDPPKPASCGPGEDCECNALLCGGCAVGGAPLPVGGPPSSLSPAYIPGKQSRGPGGKCIKQKNCLVCSQSKGDKDVPYMVYNWPGQGDSVANHVWAPRTSGCETNDDCCGDQTCTVQHDETGEVRTCKQLNYRCDPNQMLCNICEDIQDKECIPSSECMSRCVNYFCPLTGVPMPYRGVYGEKTQLLFRLSGTNDISTDEIKLYNEWGKKHGPATGWPSGASQDTPANQRCYLKDPDSNKNPITPDRAQYGSFTLKAGMTIKSFGGLIDGTSPPWLMVQDGARYWAFENPDTGRSGNPDKGVQGKVCFGSGSTVSNKSKTYSLLIGLGFIIFVAIIGTIVYLSLKSKKSVQQTIQKFLFNRK